MNNKYSCNTSMLDILFNMLLGFVMLFVIAFALIREETPKRADVNIVGNLIVTLTWPVYIDKASMDLEPVVSSRSGGRDRYCTVPSGPRASARDWLGVPERCPTDGAGARLASSAPQPRRVFSREGARGGSLRVRQGALIDTQPGRLRPSPRHSGHIPVALQNR